MVLATHAPSIITDVPLRKFANFNFEIPAEHSSKEQIKDSPLPLSFPISFHFNLLTMFKTPTKKSCETTMGNIISSVSYKYQTKDCVFNEVKAMCELYFDGSRNSLAVTLGNCCAQKDLREYGLPRTLTHMIKHFPELHGCEELHKIDQILILHDNNLLIRITNCSSEVEKSVIQVEMRNVLKELENQDSKTHAKLVQEKITAEVENLLARLMHAVTPADPQVRQVLGATALGVAAGVITYCVLR